MSVLQLISLHYRVMIRKKKIRPEDKFHEFFPDSVSASSTLPEVQRYNHRNTLHTMCFQTRNQRLLSFRKQEKRVPLWKRRMFTEDSKVRR